MRLGKSTCGRTPGTGGKPPNKKWGIPTNVVGRQDDEGRIDNPNELSDGRSVANQQQLAHPCHQVELFDFKST
jgi:hypothetical protein